MICGPARPVSGFLVHITSPVNRMPRSSSRSTALPAVWPGACPARGCPGTSMVSPSANEATSLMGIIFMAPRRARESVVR
jgi:hypothetical protein